MTLTLTAHGRRYRIVPESTINWRRLIGYVPSLRTCARFPFVMLDDRGHFSACLRVADLDYYKRHFGAIEEA